MSEGSRSRFSGRIAAATLAIGALCVPMIATAPAAQAAPEHELIGEWVGAPTQLDPGDMLSAQWNVATNDDQPAAGNNGVENVVLTLTAAGGRFTAIPDACLTSGDDLDPVSALSDGNSVLTCNLGTQVEGTAAGVLVSIAADPTQNLDTVTLTGEVAGQKVTLDPVPINWGFGMDMDWGSPNGHYTKTDTYAEVPIQWTLYLENGSVAGPNSVSYDLTVTDNNGAAVDVSDLECTPYTSPGLTVTHPWSGGSYAAEQTAPFVDTCTLVHVSGDLFRMTLTGIDYSLTQVPTQSSNGTPLISTAAAVASGEIWFRDYTTVNSSLKVGSNAPTYTSADGKFTANDDPANNVSTKTITFTGSFSSAWSRGTAGGTNWDDSYRVTTGTGIISSTNARLQQSADGKNGLCSVVDTKYTTLTRARTLTVPWDGTPNVYQDVPGSVWEYYVGNDPVVDPASASYDISAFDCGQATGWVSTLPADLSQVRAVRVSYPSAAAAPFNVVYLYLYQVVKDTAPIGQDIWEFGTTYRDNAWLPVTAIGSSITNTPDARYPFTTGNRDIVRVVGATPLVKKSVDRSTVKPGDEATFTLEYSANVAQALSDPIDNFVITDTMPVGMTYVAGSADPEPVITTVGGQQVLTWTLDGVVVNEKHALTYNAALSAGAAIGVALVNNVQATIPADNWPASLPLPTSKSSAQVVQTTNGYTSIGKTADQGFIPNIAGDGVGDGSWTVTLKSFDPVAQKFTDTIDVLPYMGDGRGTSFSGSYAVTGVDAEASATVYTTTVAPGTLSDDPNDPMNGVAGDVTGNTVEWTAVDPAEEFPAGVTAIRVIAGEMAPGATQAFTVSIKTDGVQGGDVFVNRAQARAEHTKLLMRTSAELPVAAFYSASLKKFVQAADGTWHDANTVEDYPTFHPGDKVNYRITVENTGQGELTNIVVSDDKQPELGGFTIASLAPGKTASHEYEVTLPADALGELVNTASATADESPVVTTPEINTDPAGISIVPAPAPDPATPAVGGLAVTGSPYAALGVVVIGGVLIGLTLMLISRRRQHSL